MARSFSKLRADLPPDAQARAEAQAQVWLAQQAQAERLAADVPGSPAPVTKGLVARILALIEDVEIRFDEALFGADE